jgi:hypothetical protein
MKWQHRNIRRNSGSIEIKAAKIKLMAAKKSAKYRGIMAAA